MREEFDAIGVDFATRGRRTDDYIRVVREAWTGEITQFDGQTYRIDTHIRMAPRPAHDIPILVGGSTDAALRRAGALGDGWYGLFAEPPSGEEVRERLSVMRLSADTAGRDFASLRKVVSLGRIGTPDELVAAAATLAEAGVDQIVVRSGFLERASTSQLVARIHSI